MTITDNILSCVLNSILNSMKLSLIVCLSLVKLLLRVTRKLSAIGISLWPSLSIPCALHGVLQPAAQQGKAQYFSSLPFCAVLSFTTSGLPASSRAPCWPFGWSHGVWAWPISFKGWTDFQEWLLLHSKCWMPCERLIFLPIDSVRLSKLQCSLFGPRSITVSSMISH